MTAKKFIYVFLVYFCTKNAFGVVHPDGESKVSHFQDDLGNFQFGYTVANGDGEHFHEARKDVLGRVVGSYGLTELDGRHRIVDYVADENGFRAQIRSNEPGISVQKSPVISVNKGPVDIVAHGLDFAATGDANANYGERLRDISSSVTYARPREDLEHRTARRPLSSASSEEDRSRQSHRLSIARPVHVPNTPVNSPEVEDKHNSALRQDDTPSLSRYQPPINPFTSVRQHGIPLPVQNIGRFPTNRQIPQPSTPPYGGFETRNPLLDPANFRRYPETQFPPRSIIPTYPTVTMSTVHGGIGGMPFLINPSAPQTPNIPPTHPRILRNYGLSNAGGGRVDPSRRPNLLLRAVAIPNGIQAVHVDPATGEVYRTPEQLYRDPYANRYNDNDSGDSNDDEDDDSFDERLINNFRNFNSDFLRPRYLVNRALGSPRDDTVPTSHRNYTSFATDRNRLNREQPNEASLSRPTAKDLYTISRVFDQINRQQNRHPTRGSTPEDAPYNHESRPDYPRESVYHSNNFPDLRSEFDPATNPNEFRSRFPLTYRRQPLSSHFSDHDERTYESNQSEAMRLYPDFDQGSNKTSIGSQT